MSIWQRIKTVVKSWLNAIIGRHEDPEKIMNQVVIDLRRQLAEAKKQTAITISIEKQLNKQLLSELRLAQDWETKAMQAVRAGDDNLAKEALARKTEHDKLASQLKVQWEEQKKQVDILKSGLSSMNQKIEEITRKKNLLVARQKRAEAQKLIQETLSGISNNPSAETFQRMEEKVQQIEVEAEAEQELSEEIVGDPLLKKFEALEQTGSVDEDLMALKAKMGLMENVSPVEQRVEVEQTMSRGKGQNR